MTEYRYVDQDDYELWIDSADEEASVSAAPHGVSVPAEKVEEVCAALREAASLPPVWTVEKVEVFEGDVAFAGDRITPLVSYSLNPSGARNYASQLLSAADEAEARANRPKLPTAADSVIKVGANVWVRGETVWNRAGSPVFEIDMHISKTDFAVLYDPEKAS